MDNNPKVVVMYSFKGGAGRTVCTANLAAPLADATGCSASRPLLLMDMDLDSAGLTILLEQSDFHDFQKSNYTSSRVVCGEVDLGEREQYRACYEEGMRDVSDLVGARPNSVRFLGTEVVGRQEYTMLFDNALPKMKEFIEYCGEKKIGTLLIDSASGRQEAAQVSQRVADVVVYCCRLTEQFIYGTKVHLQRMLAACEDGDRRAPAVVLLPIAVPTVREPWEKIYANRKAELDRIVTTVPAAVLVKCLHDGVCEVESFKWVETVLARQAEATLTEDQIRARDGFRRLCDEISGMIGSQ